MYRPWHIISFIQPTFGIIYRFCTDINDTHIFNNILPSLYKSGMILTMSPASWQNSVTRFLAILRYHRFLGYLSLENGKNTVTFHQKPFVKGSE